MEVTWYLCQTRAPEQSESPVTPSPVSTLPLTSWFSAVINGVRGTMARLGDTQENYASVPRVPRVLVTHYPRSQRASLGSLSQMRIVSGNWGLIPSFIFLSFTHFRSISSGGRDDIRVPLVPLSVYNKGGHSELLPPPHILDKRQDEKQTFSYHWAPVYCQVIACFNNDGMLFKSLFPPTATRTFLPLCGLDPTL